MYCERNEEERQAFLEEISKYDEEDLVFSDESGVDHQMIRECHWSPIGKPEIGERSGGARERTSLIGAVNGNKVLAPLCIFGTVNANAFIFWLKNFLVPELRKGQVVILDNASPHKDDEVAEIVEAAGCKLIYLPKYSPDFNPIEKHWANLKKFIAKIRNRFTNFADAIDFAFSQNNTVLTS